MNNPNKLKKTELIKYIEELENKIQDLNLRCAYAEFDSEASKREIEYLKKRLEQKDTEEER